MATTTAITAKSTTRTALRFGTGFVDIQRTAVQVPAVKTVYGGGPFRVYAHFDEGEAASLARVAIGDDIHPIDRAIFFKQRANGTLSGAEAKVTDKNIGQGTLLSEFAQ